MENKTIHIVSHSHWDREWYLPFEKHRMRLVTLIDDLLILFETDPDFKSFFLDGQTIVLEDYLEIRPENRAKLEKYIREERLLIGPFYILQDEFLTSSEANIRNLMIGLQQAKSFGNPSMIGYFPDAFGNAGQMPQILKQAGMEAIFFGRGVRPVGFDNKIQETGNYESIFSEMMWQSPDGSSLMGILFANWYCNGMEIPVDEKDAKEYWDRKIADADQFASTNHLLFLNGCDHQPVQKDLTAAIKTAKALYPSCQFEHSNYKKHITDVKASLKEDLSTIQGELTSQDTDGWSTLVNTCSSRLYLKQLNQQAQSALEKLAEPLCAMAHLLGDKYDRNWLTYAWKMLIQNHPHDSICGCSVDAVHREMMTRFEKTLQVSEELIQNAKTYIASKINTKELEHLGEDSIPVVAINTSGKPRTQVVTIDIDTQRLYQADPHKAWLDVNEYQNETYQLMDSSGNIIPSKIELLPTRFDYDLPADSFRKPYAAQSIRLTFEAMDVPSLGFKTFALVKEQNQDKNKESLICGNNQMENEYLHLAIQADGTLDLTYKDTGYTYKGLCEYEDTGDIGNEYIYCQPKEDKKISSKGVAANITCTMDTPFAATYKIEHILQIPSGGNEHLLIEQQNVTSFLQRTAKRNQDYINFPITTYVSLEKHSKAVKIQSDFNNQAKDHRLRMLFPTDLVSDIHIADSIFEAVTRDNRPSNSWTNPSNCQHQQAFTSVSDDINGLTIANFGLPEYEVLPDYHNAIAVTLLRCIGEMGDWGYFPTPEAQCLGTHSVNLEIIPHSGNCIDSEAFQTAYQFQTDLVLVQTDIHTGDISPCHSYLSYEGKTMALTSFKYNETKDDIMIRWFNLNNKACQLEISPNMTTTKLYHSNVIEEQFEPLLPNENKYCTIVEPAKIVTFGLEGTSLTVNTK